MESSSSESSGASESSDQSSGHSDIVKLKNAVASTDSFENHVALINALRQRGNLDDLRNARQSFFSSHSLPESVWQQWLTDEQQLASTEVEQAKLLHLAHQAVFDCPTVTICSLRLKYNLSLSDAGHPDADVMSAIQDALWLGATAHFTEAHMLWEEYASFFLKAGVSSCLLDAHTTDEANGCRIFERRLEEEKEVLSQHSDDHTLSIYLSYASYAASVNSLSAVSVYERCVQYLPSNYTAWSSYYAFCVDLADSDRRFFVARRAARSCPENLLFWARLTSEIKNASIRFVDNKLQTLTSVVERARQYVYRSADLRDASRFCMSVWTIFHELGAPAEALEIVKSSLLFNVHATVEWASSLCYAATVCMMHKYTDDCKLLFEQVVAMKGVEARWWLAYAACLERFEPESIPDVFNRAIVCSREEISVDILKDAWLAFEIKQGKERVTEKVVNVMGVADKQLSQLKETFDDQKDAGEKRRKNRGNDKKRESKRSRPSVKKTVSPAVNIRSGTDLEQTPGESRYENASGKQDDVFEKSLEEPDSKDIEMSDAGKASTGATQANSNRRPTRKIRSGGEVEPRTVYVNNLPFQATEKDLHIAFGFAGKILDVRLPRRNDGASKGIAYIEFEQEDGVEKALTKHNGTVLGRSVWVRRSQPPAGKGSKKESEGSRRRPRRGADRSSRSQRVRLELGDREGQLIQEQRGDVAGVEGSKTQADFRAMFLGKPEKNKPG